jgi:hypothetical protein
MFFLSSVCSAKLQQLAHAYPGKRRDSYFCGLVYFL